MAASSSTTMDKGASSTAIDKQEFRTLRSCDGKEFKISKSIALQLSLVSNLLDLEEEGKTDIIPLPKVDGINLDRVIGFLNMYTEESFKKLTTTEKKKRCDDFFANCKIHDFLALASAANYLGAQLVLDEACQRSADAMKNKSVAWVRKVFGVENDFTSAEEQALKNKHEWAYEGVDPDDDNEEDMNQLMTITKMKI
ncbi:SKP1-like protein 12 [Andrographis paniculata]|uniref:SKP1-like protein 12 n=1 Tax=Andrographis paniculata TaxID=175694 RepID=UPI0021E9A1E3|nr:SKP1-like protein 12 [Andrographis paniculata]